MEPKPIAVGRSEVANYVLTYEYSVDITPLILALQNVYMVKRKNDE